MDTANTSADRYSRGAIALHCIIALLIAANFGIAWAAEEMSKEERVAMMGNHKAIGLIVLVLTVVRIIWRLTHKSPPLLETLKTWEAALSKVVHGLMYVLMLAIPLAGWGMSSIYAKGAPISIFGLFGFPAMPIAHEKSTQELFHELHEITATLMLVLLALHVGAALKHQLIDKDGTMRRMVPWLK